jgi:ribonucleases P/MRP protein subunit RPP40
MVLRGLFNLSSFLGVCQRHNNGISSAIRLFADDCILYRTIRTINDVSTLQADIDKLFSWSVAWQMKLNTAKCHILNITRQRNKAQPTYTLNSKTLSNVDSYPYLVVTITADLRWREHVQLTACY